MATRQGNGYGTQSIAHPHLNHFLPTPSILCCCFPMVYLTLIYSIIPRPLIFHFPLSLFQFVISIHRARSRLYLIAIPFYFCTLTYFSQDMFPSVSLKRVSTFECSFLLPSNSIFSCTFFSPRVYLLLGSYAFWFPSSVHYTMVLRVP